MPAQGANNGWVVVFSDHAITSATGFRFAPWLGRADGMQSDCGFAEKSPALVVRDRNHPDTAILRRFACPEGLPFVIFRWRQQRLGRRAENLLLPEVNQ